MLGGESSYSVDRCRPGEPMSVARIRPSSPLGPGILHELTRLIAQLVADRRDREIAVNDPRRY